MIIFQLCMHYHRRRRRRCCGGWLPPPSPSSQFRTQITYQILYFYLRVVSQAWLSLSSLTLVLVPVHDLGTIERTKTINDRLTVGSVYMQIWKIFAPESQSLDSIHIHRSLRLFFFFFFWLVLMATQKRSMTTKRNHVHLFKRL